MKKQLKQKIDLLTNVFEYQSEENSPNGKGRYIISNKGENDKSFMGMLWDSGFEVDEYYYQWFSQAFDYMVEQIEGLNTLSEIKEKLDDIYFDEYVEADPYTGGLTEWLNSRNDNVYYLTEALENFDTKDGFELLGQAQQQAINEVCQKAKDVFISYLEE